MGTKTEMTAVKVDGCNCDGTGATFVSHANGASTLLCPCRRAMPRQFGEAKWWTTESRFYGRLDHPLVEAEASISVELPISEGNVPLHRTRANCYYPAMASVDIGVITGTSEALRELAAWLVKLADAVDEADVPHADEAVLP